MFTGPCYQVSELIIYPNSSFNLNSYGCGFKKHRKSYQLWNVEKNSGFNHKGNRYDTLVLYYNGYPGGTKFIANISKNKDRYYFKDLVNIKIKL